MKELDWGLAKKHFDEVRNRYQKSAAIALVLNLPQATRDYVNILESVFDPLAKKYNRGECTEDLYNKMMAVE